MVKIISFLFLFLFLAVPSLYAMHIAEGMLEFKWSFLWWLVATPFLLMGLYHIKKLKQKNSLYLALISTTAACVFIFSMLPLPVPIAGTTSHPTAIGLSSLLLGVLSTAVVSFISLFIQAVFLGHGGLTTLGANTVSMGISGSIVALFTFYFFKKINLPLAVRVFLVAFLADLSSYLVTALQLCLSLAGFKALPQLWIKFFLLFLPIQLPVAVLEGLLTAGIIKYIHTHKPEIIAHLLK